MREPFSAVRQNIKAENWLVITMKAGSTTIFLGVFLIGILLSSLLMKLLNLSADNWSGAMLFMITLLGFIGVMQKLLPHKISETVISSGPGLTPGRAVMVGVIIFVWAAAVIWLAAGPFVSAGFNWLIYVIAIPVLLLSINYLELKWRRTDLSDQQ
ncbi:MAG: hypothetical protein U0Z53_06105 [Blastocatellia bacterium]